MTSSASGSAATSRSASAYGVCRSPRSCDDEGRHRARRAPAWTIASNSPIGRPTNSVDLPGRRRARVRSAEPEDGLELVEQALRLDHRGDAAPAGRCRASRSAGARYVATVPSECATTASAGPNRSNTASSALPSSTPWVRPRPGRPRVRVAVRGRVEQDDPVAGGDERLHERGELAAAAAPAVHEVDRRVAVAEDVPPHRRSLGGHGERLAAGWQRCRRHPGRQR